MAVLRRRAMRAVRVRDDRLGSPQNSVGGNGVLTRRHWLAGAAATLAAASSARAQAEWPNRPVKVIVPYPPAGGADTVSRILFQKLGELWGQSFVIDNRGGAGGTIGEAVAAKSDPDGYTVLYDATAFSVNPALYPRLSFDYGKDFQPVFLASLVPNILVVTPSVPVNTVADVVALAKSTPGGLDFASSGNGTLQHLCLELFGRSIGAKINHIPYRGGGLALNDVVGGQVKFFFSNGSSSIGLVQGGKVKAIAHTGHGPARHPAGPAGGAGQHSGLRGLRVERRVRADRHAGCRHRQAQRRAQPGTAPARHRGAAEIAQCRLQAEHARGVSRLRRSRDRQVGQGGARGRHQARRLTSWFASAWPAWP